MKYKALIILLLVSFAATAQAKKPAIKIMSATVQDWIGGAKGLSGTTYTVKVCILSNQPVEFKSMWLDKQSVPFDVQTFFKDPAQKPAAGDSVLLVYVRRNNFKNEGGGAEIKAAPIKYNGEALVAYIVAGKPRYITVKSFSKLKIMKGI